MARSLIDQIEQDALDSKVSVSDALRKCVALGGKAHSQDLRTWASQGLRGYTGGTELPEYRKIEAAIALDGATAQGLIRNQRIPPSTLPDFVQDKISETFEARGSIDEIESSARRGNEVGEAVKFSLPMGANLARYMTHEAGDQFQTIISLYWMVSPTALEGIVGQVRTRLVELVAELRGQMGKGEEIPSPEVAANAVHVAIYGGRRHRFTFAASQASGSGSSNLTTGEPASWWTPWRKVGAAVVGLATIAGAVFGYLEWIK